MDPGLTSTKQQQTVGGIDFFPLLHSPRDVRGKRICCESIAELPEVDIRPACVCTSNVGSALLVHTLRLGFSGSYVQD